MLIGLNVRATRDVQLKVDPARGTPDATIFKIGTLDSYVMAELNDSLAEYASDEEGTAKISSIRVNATAIKTVRFGLKGWTNVKDDEGNDIEFKTNRTHLNGKAYMIVSDDTMQALPIEWILELSGLIRAGNTVTQDDAKNSASA